MTVLKKTNNILAALEQVKCYKNQAVAFLKLLKNYKVSDWFTLEES